VQSQPDGIGPQLLRFPDFIAIILQPFHTVHDRVQPKSQSSFESPLLPSIGTDCIETIISDKQNTNNKVLFIV